MKKQVNVVAPAVQSAESATVNNTLKRVAAYVRVSTSEEEQLHSYNAQISEYTNRIKENPDWVLIDIYADEGKTGTTSKNRTAFNRLMQDCINGKIDLIITKSISRFARNTQIAIEKVKLLKKHNVEIFFEKENIYSFDGKSDMLFNILASVAQEESRNISENSRWGIVKKMKDGKPVVNHNRFLGYTKDENGELVIVEEEAKIVRLTYKMYLDGKGYYAIAKEMESLGYKTGSGSLKWYDSTIKGILTNEKYYGQLLQQKTITTDYLNHTRKKNDGIVAKYEVENNHQAIISMETWDKVQAEINRRYLIASGKNTDRTKYTTRYALSGKLICATCGGSLKRKRFNQGTPSERTVWACTGHIFHIEKCDMKAVGDTTIKKSFVDVFNQVIADKNKFFDTFAKTVEKVILNGSNANELKRVESEIQKLQSRISNLITMRTNEEISKEDFQREYSNLNEKQNELLNSKNMLLNSNISSTTNFEKLNLVREIVKTKDKPLIEFDDKLFIGIIDKVLISSPIAFKFVLNNGIEIEFDGTKYHDGRKFKNRPY